MLVFFGAPSFELGSLRLLSISINIAGLWPFKKSDKFMIQRHFPLFLLAGCVASCAFSGDVLRQYLPEEVAEAEAIYNERDILSCAVSIYRIPEEYKSAGKPLSLPKRASSDWMALPVNGKMDYGSFATQALYYGDGCFEREAQQILGLEKLSNYYSIARRGFFIELRHDLILVHDMDLDLLIVSARAR